MLQTLFAGFDWINFILLLALIPSMTMYLCRVLPPRYSTAKTFWILLAGCAFMSMIELCLSSFTVNAQTPVLFVYGLLESLAYLVLWWRLSNATFWRCLFYYVIFIILTIFGFTAGSFVDSLLMTVAGPSYILSNILQDNARVLLVTIFQIMLAVVVSGFIAKRAHRVSVDVRWSMFALMLMTQVFASYLVIALLTWEKYALWNVLLLCVYVLLCAAVDFYVMRTFRSMKKNAELEQHVALLAQQQKLEHAQYEALEEQMRTVRRLRHDYRNTLDTIGVLLSMNEPEKIREILDSTAEQLEKAAIVYTGNQIVDAVLYGKSVSANEKGISLHCALIWPKATLAVSDTELMRIFNNLLDNAIRYCQTLPEGTPKKIDVSSAIQGQIFALRFSNTYQGLTPPDIPENDPLDADHGHGLAIVREAAEGSGGGLTVNCGDGMLTFTTLIGLADSPVATA